MRPHDSHKHTPDSSFDAGDLDCGNGLLLLIRKHLDPLNVGQLLEIISSESSVEQDLPSWCRLTKNELVSWTKQGSRRSFLICKGSLGSIPKFPGIQMPSGGESIAAADSLTAPQVPDNTSVDAGQGSAENKALTAGSKPSMTVGTTRSADSRTPVSPMHHEVPPLPVMGVGSWPRPKWLLTALHEFMQGRLSEQEFQETANDAVRLAVEAQLRAGVDVITDGEQRRDNYASFVAQRLDNCQLIPLVDLLALVDDPASFEKELQALDVPATEIRHPAVLGKLEWTRPLTLHEFEFVRTLTDKPVKIALPGPYLLTRTMWSDCFPERAYETREELADDLVPILRQEIECLLNAGVYMVQLDEPVLTEVVFAPSFKSRHFMCGALGERKDAAEELEFAVGLINDVTSDFPTERLGLHICRGNWSVDESVALQGDYEPLIPALNKINVGTLFLEFCTHRAGSMDLLSKISSPKRIGIGVVNQKNPQLPETADIVSRAQTAIALIGKDRIALNPDCGFATFADQPLTSAVNAEEKLRRIVEAARILRKMG